MSGAVANICFSSSIIFKGPPSGLNQQIRKNEHKHMLYYYQQIIKIIYLKLLYSIL